MGHYAGEMDGSPGPNHQSDEDLVVTRVARAIAADDWDAYVPLHIKDGYRIMARAAIAAMREPTEAMLKAARERLEMTESSPLSSLIASIRCRVAQIKKQQENPTANSWLKIEIACDKLIEAADSFERAIPSERTTPGKP